VADNALAVLACCLRMVAVAVKDSCAVVRHLQTPSLGSNEVTVLTRRRLKAVLSVHASASPVSAKITEVTCVWDPYHAVTFPCIPRPS
jgi:hypothetical protein